MSDVAAEGLNLTHELEWLIAKTPAEFATKIAAMHEDESLNAKISSYALDFIEQNFGANTTQRTLAEATARKSPAV
jgi:hypothetical protein